MSRERARPAGSAVALKPLAHCGSPSENASENYSAESAARDPDYRIARTNQPQYRFPAFPGHGLPAAQGIPHRRPGSGLSLTDRTSWRDRASHGHESWYSFSIIRHKDGKPVTSRS
jgi:hypothetical protein